MSKKKVIPFSKKAQMGNLQPMPFDHVDDFEDALRTFENRLGGVNLSQLEAGDQEASKIATRSLRKEFMKFSTANLYRS